MKKGNGYQKVRRSLVADLGSPPAPGPAAGSPPVPVVEEEPKTEVKTRVKTILNVVGYTRGREAGIKEGFADGVRYIVTLAEENLAKELKLRDRHALRETGQLPAWWIITLGKALHIDDLPDDIALEDQRKEEPAQ